ncbi:MAG: ABC transporter ATP-binding protein [Bacteroidales bacterium]|nr:ABC transporter ATP-binding protein [Bacteroidales bacterium]MBQ6689301.1 ABC transporter ATP-binding protein [Bacteroidales bacterium]
MINDLILKIRNLEIGYGKETLYKGISFDIRKGDCIMLCGANGSGKTTLLKKITSLCDNIIMIPARIPKVAGFTTGEYIRLICYKDSDARGRLSAEQEDMLKDAIRMMSLDKLTDKDISLLSDGEFQKAGIASALARKATVILLDEPTAFLDAENRLSVLNALNGICKQTGCAIIFSTHDLNDGLKAATKVIALCADGHFRCSSENMQETVNGIFKGKV